MEQRLSMVTLGVRDMERARRFYRDGLGWRESSASNEAVVFFNAGGLVLGLFGREELAADAQVPADGPGFSGVALAQNLSSKAEVDAALVDAARAGATIVKSAADTPWGGYSGYFTDPEGFLWEVAWNPFFPIDDRGIVQAPI